jgi:hypothetical protein
LAGRIREKGVDPKRGSGVVLLKASVNAPLATLLDLCQNWLRREIFRATLLRLIARPDPQNIRISPTLALFRQKAVFGGQSPGTLASLYGSSRWFDGIGTHFYHAACLDGWGVGNSGVRAAFALG